MVLVALLAGGWYAAQRLGITSSAAQSVYEQYLHARIYHRPNEARGLSIGPAQDSLPGLVDEITTRGDVVTRSDVASEDGRRHSISSTSNVCIRAACKNYQQTATVCRTDEGWRVCAFSEIEIIEPPPR